LPRSAAAPARRTKAENAPVRLATALSGIKTVKRAYPMSTEVADAFALAGKLLQILVDNGAGADQGALAVAGLTAQVLLNLANGDKQRAITALHEAFLPNVEFLIGALNTDDTAITIETRH
jgi:hypothetical protein